MRSLEWINAVNKPTGKKPYSVLLLYPDYLTDNYGQETYLVHVEAGDAESAVVAARADVAISFEYDWSVENVEDFYPLLVCAGHVEDLYSHRRLNE